MPVKRYWLQLLVFLVAVLLALAAAFLAEHLCRIIWLPGETGFALRDGMGRAAARLLGRSDVETGYCAGSGFAVVLNAAVPWLGLALLGLAAVQLGYELTRNRVFRRWMVERGGHTIMLGETEELARLVASEPSRRRVLLVPSPQGEASLQRRFWRHITVAPNVPVERLGLAKARRIYAVSRSDIRNRDLALAARRANAAEVVVRIESAALRAAYAHAGGMQMEDMSVLQGMMRDGAILGDPAARLRRGERPAHIVLCGGGAGLDELLSHLAGFGYGLEIAPPRFTVLQTDGRLSPALERLGRRSDILTLVSGRIDRADPHGLEAALMDALGSDVAPTAIHCIDDAEGSAAAIAMLAASAVAAMDARGTRVIAYGEPGADSSPGIDWVVPDDLSEAVGRKKIRDRIARAVHEHYLALQRRTRGNDFGSMEAERPWEGLAMAYRDDNRAVADHIDHMLAATGYRRGALSANAPQFTAAEIERMARMAHSRWMAARALKGWRYGPVRDDRRLLHPSMVGYDDLSEPEKEKDRDQVRAVPHILATVDQAIERLPEEGS